MSGATGLAAVGLGALSVLPVVGWRAANYCRVRTAMIRALTTAILLAAVAPAPGSDPQADVHRYLMRHGFAASELSRLDNGEVIARATLGSSADREILVVAAVKIRAARAQVAAYYGQMIAYVDGAVTLAFGRFGSPPSLADASALAFDAEDIDRLKACRPGKCEIRISGAGLNVLQKAIDWSAPDYVERTNALARRQAVEYIAAYQARGDAALMTYNDRAQPVALGEQWRGILAGSPFFHEYSPELRSYLERFPTGALAGARNVFYWAREKLGPSVVISLVHGIVYDPPSRPDRTIVVQKQLYASRYFDGSLAIATLLDARDGDRPATYLVYANRSRGDLLKGGFGGLKRTVARSQANKAAEQLLGTIKQVLEATGNDDLSRTRSAARRR